MINSSQKVVFHVFSRESAGTSSSKKLRKQGKVVGNIFGLGKESLGVYMDAQGIKKLYASHGDTSLVYLQVDELKKQVPVLINSYETRPIGDEITHVSFRRVNLSDPIQADVSITLVGEVKIDNSVVNQMKDVITVEALPADLPDNINVDISGLSEIGQSITLAEVALDTSKVTLILEEDQQPSDVVLVSIQEVKEEVEEEPEEIETEITVGKGEDQAEEDSSDEKETPKEDLEKATE